MGAPCACNYTNSRNPRYVARFNSQTKYDISNIYIESSALSNPARFKCAYYPLRVQIQTERPVANPIGA